MNFFAIGTLDFKVHYGFGDTAPEALHDAMHDLRRHGSTQLLDDVDTFPCTDLLRAQYMISGVVHDYSIRDGRAYTDAQAAAVDVGLKVEDDGTVGGDFYISDADAVRLGMRSDVDVVFQGPRMTVYYCTTAGRPRRIHKDPVLFENELVGYERHLLDVYGAVVGLLEVAAKRDAEADAS